MSVQSETVEIKDTPIKVKERIEKYLVKQKMTKASFARIVGISSNALGRFLGQDEPRGDNQTFEASYLYFRQLKAEKKARKAKKRKARSAVSDNEKAVEAAAKRAKSLADACAEGYKLLNEHYFLSFLTDASDALADALTAFNDPVKRRAASDTWSENLTPLEELLMLIDVAPLKAAFPDYTGDSAPALPFAAAFIDLPPAERLARPAQEAAHKTTVEGWRAWTRLVADATTLRSWFGDGKTAPPNRLNAPLTQPPARIAFEVDQAEPKDEKRSAADAKAEIDDVDHTRCCLNRVHAFRSLYAN